jgi:hypothetical protein
MLQTIEVVPASALGHDGAPTLPCQLGQSMHQCLQQSTIMLAGVFCGDLAVPCPLNRFAVCCVLRSFRKKLFFNLRSHLICAFIPQKALE